MNASERPARRAHQLYGRRVGHALSPGRAALVAERMPLLRVDPTTPGLDHPSALFAGAADVWLEIGFGGGEHLAWQAEHNPDIGIIGVEPFVNGVASLVALVERGGLRNVRVCEGDARDLLPAIGAETLGRVFVLFPDPWPKRRHLRRRLMTPQTIAALHRVLKPGGELRVGTDIPSYLRVMFHAILTHGGFEWLAEGPQDWRQRPEDWPPTRYEEKAIAAGRVPVYLRFARR